MKDFLQINNISKAFPGVQALDDVSFTVNKGEIHALLGENGAGKSTLIKILAGVYQADEGAIIIDGKKAEINEPVDAKKAGISVMHQENNLLPALDIATNIMLGEEIANKAGIVNFKEMNKRAKEVMDMICLEIPPTRKVSTLTFAERQMVEVAKAVAHNAKIVIMDEPTAALTNREKQQLYKTIHWLKAKGVSIIYISHLMDEVLEMSDRITVLRDGKFVGTEETSKLDFDSLIKMMVGRKIDYVDRQSVATDKIIMEVKDLNAGVMVQNISFKLKAGEILGIAGLAGAGRTEIARAIFGVDKKDSGTIIIKEKEVAIKNPLDAIKNGIALVPEDRKTQGLQLGMSVEYNIAYSNLDKLLNKLKLINFKALRSVALKYIQLFNINPKQPEKLTKFLSGGNQQKVVVGRCVYTDPEVLIIDEPTRGMDIGAKQEIHNILHEMVKDGKSVIMISSEMAEVLKMSDRVLIVRGGTIVGEVSKQEATQEKILTYAMGGK